MFILYAKLTFNSVIFKVKDLNISNLLSAIAILYKINIHAKFKYIL